MSRFIIRGGNKLNGDVEVQGAKNSALPILAATILTKGENIIYNCSGLSDVDVCLRILRYLGCSAKLVNTTAIVKANSMNNSDIPDDLMREMRSSIVFLGAILSKTGKANLSFPGGCELGPRPIDLHIKALQKMGVNIVQKYGKLSCSVDGKLKGAKIDLSFPSVGATENIILAAVKAKGVTTITNAAREPEITDLCEYLIACGAKIYGAGEGTIVIDGVEELYATDHSIIADRVVATTLMSASAITGSTIYLKGIIQNHLSSIIPVYEEAGCEISCKEGVMKFKAPEKLKAVSLIRTMPYPGFPTDAQAPVMASMVKAEGATVFVENIFENRYKHIEGLCRLGADISAQGKVAVVNGVKSLYGATIEAQDLRGAAALVVAGLSAEGVTDIGGICYLERGYENFEVVLSALGANIKKV